MAIPMYQVDAFTDEPFKGNPAGVCLLAGPKEDSWMQSVAAEMNLSETAFVWPEKEGFRLRWFTPKVEVELCGHATLATSHILWETGVLARNREAKYKTMSGFLGARLDEEGRIELDFPSRPVKPEPPDWIEDVAGALGIKLFGAGLSTEDVLVEAADEATVRSVQPDFGVVRTLPARGIIVTARSSDPRFDFVSRFFAPAVGVDEDPVTGSSHTVLAPYWAARLGKTSFTAFQASARGGVLKVSLAGDRVKIAGNAVTVVKGELMA
jgi:PhzF family phenazine biosynthesis protein